MTEEQRERKRQTDRERQARLRAAGTVRPLTDEQRAAKRTREVWREAYAYYLRWCRREGLL